MGRKGPERCWWACKLVQPLGAEWRFLKKLKWNCSLSQRHPALGIYRKRTKARLEIEGGLQQRRYKSYATAAAQAPSQRQRLDRKGQPRCRPSVAGPPAIRMDRTPLSTHVTDRRGAVLSDVRRAEKASPCDWNARRPTDTWAWKADGQLPEAGGGRGRDA